MGWFADDYKRHERGDVTVQVTMRQESGDPYTSTATFRWPGPNQLFVSCQNSSCLDAKRYFQHRILELCQINTNCFFVISSRQFSDSNTFNFYPIMPNTFYPLIPMAANLRTLVNQFLDNVPQTEVHLMVFPTLNLPTLPAVINPLISDCRQESSDEVESSDGDELPGPARSTQPGPAPSNKKREAILRARHESSDEDEQPGPARSTPRNKNRGADAAGGGEKRRRQTSRNKNKGLIERSENRLKPT